MQDVNPEFTTMPPLKKLASFLFILVGIPFGTSLFTYLPVTLGFLALEKTRMNFLFRPLVIGAHVGLLLTYLIIVILYLRDALQSPMAFVYALRLYFEGYFPAEAFNLFEGWFLNGR